MNRLKRILRRIGLTLVIIVVSAIAFRMVLAVVFGIEYRDMMRKLKAEGEPVTFAQRKPAPVPNSENAALIYNQVFTLMTTGEGGKPYIPGSHCGIMNKSVTAINDAIKRSMDFSRWTDQQQQEVSALVRSTEMQRIYSLIEEASEKPSCVFDLNYESGRVMNLAHLLGMEGLVRLVCVRAFLEARSGDLPKAMDTIRIVLKCSYHLKHEPIFVSQSFRGSWDALVLDCLHRIVQGKIISQKMAGPIDLELASHGDVSAWQVPLVTERLLLLEEFAGAAPKDLARRVLDGMNPVHVDWSGPGGVSEERFRFQSAFFWMASGSPDDMGRDLERLNPLFNEDTLVGFVALNIVSRTLAWFWLPVLKKEAVEYETAVTGLRNELAVPIYQNSNLLFLHEQIPKYCVLARGFLPELFIVREEMNVHHTRIAVCQTALALKTHKAAHGAYPKTLDLLTPAASKDMLTDPFSGKDLVYRTKGSGFIPYSIGTNMKDDGGTSDKENPRLDIVWEE